MRRSMIRRTGKAILLAAVLGIGLAACQPRAPETPGSLPFATASESTVEALPTTQPSPSPTLTPPPTGTPTPAPAPTLLQLTQGGCCVEPTWSPDGSRVLYIDQPSPDIAVGYWSVGLDGGPPELYTDRLGIYSRDMSYLAYPRNGQAIVERVSDGQTWTIPSGGRAISFSPDGAWVAWTAGQSGPPFETAPGEVWVSRVDGSQPRLVTNVYGGGFSGWFPDNSLLVSGVMDIADPDAVLWKVPLGDGEIKELARGGRLRSPAISPGGSWVAYQVVFTGDPAAEGIWLVNTGTGERRKLGLFGAYRWRDDGHLLVVPLDLSQTAHQLWEVDPANGEERPLTNGQITPFKIANGDWSVSPDGNRIAFVSAGDGNIWLLEFPGD